MISIIVTWRDRLELGRALPSLIDAAQDCGGDVTVVNYGGSKEMLAQQTLGFADRIRIVNADAERHFHKARAQNIGAAHGRHGVLFFCDADIILARGTLPALFARVCETANAFGTLAGVRETEQNSRGASQVVCFGYELTIRLANGRRLKIVDHEEDAEDGTRNAPGLLLVRRAHFQQIGGYNSELHGWGWEDQDMIGRLTLGAGLERVLLGTALHISHDDSLRIAHYPPVRDRWESRDRMFRQALANYDRGHFQGTYFADVGTASVSVEEGALP